MFCYDPLSVTIFETLKFGVFSAGVPVLVYYSHISAILVSLVLGTFVYLNNRTLQAKILMVTALVFSALSMIDILLWTQIDSSILMFLWSFWPFLFICVYLLALYFLYVFIERKDAPFSYKLVGTALLLVTLGLSVSPYNLTSFDLANCNAVEGLWVWQAVYALSFLIFVWMVAFGVRKVLTETEITARRQALFVTIGIAIFFLAFSASAYIATIANFLGSEPDVFLFEQYGYFGMAVFTAFLTYTIVQYNAFNIKLIAAQALVVGLFIVIASEFAFIRNPINLILVSVTLLLTAVIGFVLIRSVQREIAQREHIEQLAKDLEKANAQQVVLIHFITHQIKGFVTKSRNIFAGLLEGDYGPVPETMRPLIEEGFRSDTKGAMTIQQILDASNIKSGKMTYKNEPFDLKELVEEIVKDLKVAADQKSLALTVTAGEGPFTLVGDRMQMLNAVKNLIDNSIKYTPSGSVSVTLAKEAEKIRFQIQDTGVGITPEDMTLLFTEGGHGKESTKVNVDSTGFGLYIVKNIIEAHKGRVWAESEGAGKGSKFIVELPA